MQLSELKGAGAEEARSLGEKLAAAEAARSELLAEGQRLMDHKQVTSILTEP
jgi:hypothetical protein